MIKFVDKTFSVAILFYITTITYEMLIKYSQQALFQSFLSSIFLLQHTSNALILNYLHQKNFGEAPQTPLAGGRSGAPYRGPVPDIMIFDFFSYILF